MRLLRITACLLVFLGLALFFLPAKAAPETTDRTDRIAIILDVKGPIGPATYDYIDRELKKAAERNAALLILEMDTPGGLFSSTRDIISAILASPVPVATYVSPAGAHAASAGTYILYGSHIAAMAPGTNLGAATPVDLSGRGPLPGPAQKGLPDKEPSTNGDALSHKAVSDAAAYIRSLAELRSRNAEWAEAAVREAESLTSSEAREKNVIDFVADDIESLLAAANGKVVDISGTDTKLETAGATVVRVEMDWRTRFLSIITDPNIAFLLMTLGAYGLIYEFSNPGAFVPGVIGVICLTIGLFALNVLPVNYAGMLLLGLGLAFMVGEAFVPSFGILGIGGAVAFAIGAAILMDTDAPGFTISWITILGSTGVSFGLLVLLLSQVVKGVRGAVTTGSEGMIGADVQIVDWNDTEGHVRYGGELWSAQSREKAHYKPGTTVCILEMKGLKLVVGAPENVKQGD